MLDRPDISTAGIRVTTPDPIPVGRLLRGKPVTEVVETLPRLFNLCRSAHSIAIRLALGLELRESDDLAAEIRDEHLLRLAIMLPGRLKQAAIPFKRNDPDSLADALFGAGTFARSPVAFEAFLQSGCGIAPVLSEIRNTAFGYQDTAAPQKASD